MGNWTNNMKHFLIITNSFKDKNLKLTNEIKGYIEKKGASALRVPETMQSTQRLRLMRLRRRQSVCLC